MPVEVEAVRWTGKNTGEVKAWMMSQYLAEDEHTSDPQIAMFVRRRASGMTETLFRNLIANPAPDVTAALWVAASDQYVGLVSGEWILKDSLGFYPCADNGEGTAPMNYQPVEGALT